MASGQANAEIRVDGGAPTLTCLHEAPIAVQAFHLEVADVCGTLSDGAHHGGGLNGQDAHSGRILPVTYAPMTLAFKPGQSEAAGATFITEEFAPTLQAQNNGSTAVPAVLQPTTYAAPAIGAFVPSEVAGTLMKHNGAGPGETQNAAYVLGPEGYVPPVATTLAARDYKGPSCGRDGITGNPVAPVDMAVRRLTPRECERLMGFPDDWTLVPWKGKDAHDGGRYKALGNSIAVNCLRWVGRRIELVDKTWGVP